MRTKSVRWGAVAATAMLLTSCGSGTGSESQVAADSPPAQSTDAPSSVTTTAGPTASSAPWSDTSNDIADGTGTSTTTAGRPTTTIPTTTATTATTATHEPTMPVIGQELIAQLFGHQPPDRVVLMWEGTLEVHAAGRDPVAYEHPLAGANANVVADQVVNWTETGQSAAPLSGQGTATRVAEGWTVVPYFGQAAIANTGCAESPISGIELRTQDGGTHIATLAVHDLGGAPDEVRCMGFDVRDGVVLTALSGPDGNSSQLVDSTGRSVIGGDYAGYFSLGPGGDTIVYTDVADGPTPHSFRTIVLRSTKTGAELGRWSVETPVAGPRTDGRWITAPVYSFAEQLGVVSIDLATGRQRFVETPVRVLLP